MKRKKEQWKPKINCFLKDGTPVEADQVVIPDEHLVYRYLAEINKERLSA